MRRLRISLFVLLLLLCGCGRQPEIQTQILVNIREGAGYRVENNGQYIQPGEDAVFFLHLEDGVSLAGAEYDGDQHTVLAGDKLKLTLEDVKYSTHVNLRLTDSYATVTYEPNGAIGEATTYVYDTTYHPRPNTATGEGLFARDGYTLVSWNTRPDGTGQRIGLGSRTDAPEAGLTLYADKLIAGEVRLGIVEYLVGDDAAGLIAAHGSCVILAAGLKVNALDLPAHRPVDLPGELCSGAVDEVVFALVSALAGVVTLGAVVREAVEGGGVLAANGAVNDYGGVSLTLAFLRILSTEAVENIKNLGAVLYCVNDSFVVSAGAVLLRLISEVYLNAELGERTLEFLLEVSGIAFAAAKGIGNVNVGFADILFPIGRNVFGNLAEAVKLIPGEEQTCLFAGLAQSAANEIAGCYIAEVAYMNRTGGADACCTDILLLVRLGGDYFFCYRFGPMHTFNHSFQDIMSGFKLIRNSTHYLINSTI